MKIKIDKKTVVILLVAILAVVVYYIVFKNAENISYITEKVKFGSIRKSVNAVGEIGAIKLVNVGAQASGQIETIHVKIGDKVKKGDLVAMIDSTSQKNEIYTTAAKLDSYKSQLKSSEVALKMAESKYNRSKALLDYDAISIQEFENIENEYEMAKTKIIEIDSLIKQTEISLETAKKNLAYTVITAPLDGTIVSLPVKVGQTVNAMMNTPTIAQIADLSRVEILIEISEGDILQIKSGQKVKFSVLSDDTVYETSLKSIDPGLTTLTNDKYSGVTEENKAIYYYGRAEIANDNERLRIGMTTQNLIEVENLDNVLVIPVTAIYEKDGRKYVKTIADKKAHVKEIITGLSDDLMIEVRSGLKESEEIVITQMSAKEIEIKSSELPEGLDL
ncbi:MAG: efflux RND transporter periplasmic adaptor subunit [Campylobacteraceae bacterium]|jgi:macrolide-specific efflux system membrane fusion protein|nr:efflux RND transporter periplasmic adaptor subunit [Campylobacteraceae bacterium]